jgi:hypothetical protein
MCVGTHGRYDRYPAEEQSSKPSARPYRFSLIEKSHTETHLFVACQKILVQLLQVRIIQTQVSYLWVRSHQRNPQSDACQPGTKMGSTNESYALDVPGGFLVAVYVAAHALLQGRLDEDTTQAMTN